MAFKQRSL